MDTVVLPNIEMAASYQNPNRLKRWLKRENPPELVTEELHKGIFKTKLTKQNKLSEVVHSRISKVNQHTLIISDMEEVRTELHDMYGKTTFSIQYWIKNLWLECTQMVLPFGWESIFEDLPMNDEDVAYVIRWRLDLGKFDQTNVLLKAGEDPIWMTRPSEPNDFIKDLFTQHQVYEATIRQHVMGIEQLLSRIPVIANCRGFL